MLYERNIKNNKLEENLEEILEVINLKNIDDKNKLMVIKHIVTLMLTDK